MLAAAAVVADGAIVHKRICVLAFWVFWLIHAKELLRGGFENLRWLGGAFAEDLRRLSIDICDCVCNSSRKSSSLDRLERSGGLPTFSSVDALSLREKNKKVGAERIIRVIHNVFVFVAHNFLGVLRGR